ncbi:SusD/RagB family nutrient-binding outer membrane lipoprotein [Olivibacter sitiensis]|uniref:SusD/RagB family nutrient-binding outer membrane lipoprotein n=1 Tax=Olivibacter sitiensis TaxID=376470 RepID=UPI000A058A0A|nr:SusD/RagB family nutrient-binding outer membrane lipoprotein [Olivibacter sitiensis]
MRLINVTKSIYIGLLSATLFFQGCGDYFDVGNNPNLVTEPSLNSLLSSVTHRTGMNAYRYGSTASYYVQYLASPSEGSATDIYDITDLSTSWAEAYYAMSDAYDMITAAEESGANLHVGVGKLLTAYNLSLVSDTWDSAPYTEAFSRVETFTPVYDSPEQLYQTIGQLIDEAIVAFGSTDATMALDPTLDLIHGGDVNKWIRTAYGLKARYLNKISKKSAYNPQAVLSALDDAYLSAEDDMKMGLFSGNNPWASIAISNANSLLGGWLSSNLIKHVNGETYGIVDPRVAKITDLTVNGNYVGTPNGGGNQGPLANTVHDECYISTNSPVTTEEAPVYIMTFEELKFVEAEAAFRAGLTSRAYEAYLAGIRASMAKFQVAAAARDSYIAEPSVSVGASALTLDLIFKEKYVATYLNFEAWNDARRHDYGYQSFQMPLGAVLPTFIRQVAIPNSEIVNNPGNIPTQVSLDSPLWWDKP